MRRAPLLDVLVIVLLSGCVQALDKTTGEPPGTQESTTPHDALASAPAWPHEGSTVRFQFATDSLVPGASNETNGTASWTYHAGQWVGSCDESYVAQVDGAPDARGAIHRNLTSARASNGPFDTSTPLRPGDDVTVWRLERGCEVTQSVLHFEGTTGGRSSAVSDPAESEYHTDATTWDARTGLVLDWQFRALHSRSVGFLVETDAPVP